MSDTQKPTPWWENKKIFKCKHCKVQVSGRADLRPVLGKQHARWCPRAKKYN